MISLNEAELLEEHFSWIYSDLDGSGCRKLKEIIENTFKENIYALSIDILNAKKKK